MPVRYFAQDQSWPRLAGVAGGKKGGEAARNRSDHEDRPCLKGGIYYLAARGQGFAIADDMVSS